MMKWGLLRSCFFFSPIYGTLVLKVGEGYRGSSQPNLSGPYASLCPHQPPNSALLHVAAAQGILVELKAPDYQSLGADKKGLVVKPDSVLGFKPRLCPFQLHG